MIFEESQLFVDEREQWHDGGFGPAQAVEQACWMESLLVALRNKMVKIKSSKGPLRALSIDEVE